MAYDYICAWCKREYLELFAPSEPFYQNDNRICHNCERDVEKVPSYISKENLIQYLESEVEEVSNDTKV